MAKKRDTMNSHPSSLYHKDMPLEDIDSDTESPNKKELVPK
jgi:hypothetical protein